jgi:hypothetical protein
MKIKINQNALKKIENTIVGPIIGKKAEQSILRAVREAQQKMIQDFESHPVTQEIDSGPEGYNQSGTLGGYGNLYSFIGFEEGMDPLTVIRRLLKKALTIRAIPSNHKSMIMQFEVTLPSKEDLFNATPMPWQSGRSWAEGIERGISGLGNYINRTSFSSRSGEGVQTKNRIRGGQFRNTKYLSAILVELQKNIYKFIQ